MSSFGNPVSGLSQGSLFDVAGNFDIFRPRDRYVEVVSRRPELAQGKLLAFETAGVNTILRDDHEVISNMQSDNGVLNPVV